MYDGVAAFGGPAEKVTYLPATIANDTVATAVFRDSGRFGVVVRYGVSTGIGYVCELGGVVIRVLRVKCTATECKSELLTIASGAPASLLLRETTLGERPLVRAAVFTDMGTPTIVCQAYPSPERDEDIDDTVRSFGDNHTLRVAIPDLPSEGSIGIFSATASTALVDSLDVLTSP
jgi:hypothetical protein